MLSRAVHRRRPLLCFRCGRLYRTRWRPDVASNRSHTVQMVDPIGAGDAYVGGYLWATLGGRASQEAVNIAATVAALKCSTGATWR